MTKSFSHRLVSHAAAIAACVATFTTAAVLAHDYFQARHNRSELAQLAQDTVSRAEYAIDYAVLTAFTANDEISDPCLPKGISSLQKLVHARSVVKDIRVIDAQGNVECAAFAETSTRNEVLGAGKPGANKDYTLHKIDVAGRAILGLAWRPENERGYLVGLDIESQLFDALPKTIRDDTNAIIAVKDLGAISEIGQTANGDNPEVSIAESKRYPLRIVLRLDRDCFVAWNSSYRSLFTFLGSLFGLLVGLVLIREVRRPVSPQQELRNALKNREFKPYFQATFDAKTKHISGCEVLMRWVKPDGSIVPPNLFIPLAEATGEIIPMTRALMDDSLTLLSPYLRRDRGFKIAFNITPDDFIGSYFPSHMRALSRTFGLATKQIVLELTERQSSLDIQALKSAVAAVRDLGFRVALDDMGTGHNGLSHLQDIGADIIKIDKKFVDFIGKEATANAIIELLVSLAKKLSMQTLAEGVETEEQLAALVNAGVDLGQGYLIGKPMPFEQFAASLQEQEQKKSKGTKITVKAA